MSTQTLVLLELLLIFGGLIGYCVWDLARLRRDNRRARRERDGNGPPTASG